MSTPACQAASTPPLLRPCIPYDCELTTRSGWICNRSCRCLWRRLASASPLARPSFFAGVCPDPSLGPLDSPYAVFLESGDLAGQVPSSACVACDQHIHTDPSPIRLTVTDSDGDEGGCASACERNVRHPKGHQLTAA